MQRLQVLFAYMFYRCSYYPENMIKAILALVRPPHFRATAGELNDAQHLILSLQGTVMRTHMRLTTHFIKNTDYGREFFEEAEKRRRSKLKLPELDVMRVMESLEVSVAVVRTVWYPLAAVVPVALWHPIDTVDSDFEECETDTPTVALFRFFSAEIVAKTARVWTASQQELRPHVEVAILKDISAILRASPWPPLVVTGNSLRIFRKGIYAPDNIDKFFDQVFQPKETLPEEESPELADKQLDGSPNGRTEGQPEGNLTQGSTKTTEAMSFAAGNTSAAGDTQPKAFDVDYHTDGPEDIDAVIEKQINAAMESVKMTGRRSEFETEFSETGGRGLGAMAMTELMDQRMTPNVLEVLADTSDALLNHPYVAEEAMAVSSMSAGATAKYAQLRLEHENTAIMEAIWRLQQIVDGNQTELNDIRSRFEAQLEKRKYFATLNKPILKTYAEIHSAEDELRKLEGTEGDDDREKGKGPLKTRKSWQERAAETRSKVGMKRQGKLGMNWEGLKKDVRSSLSVLGDSVDASQHEDKGDDAQSQSQS
jgi:hypothetical protein